MGMTLQTSNQDWAQTFRSFIVGNIRHWLAYAQNDKNRLAHEMAQVLHGLTYALSLPEAWPIARDLMLQIDPLVRRQGLGTQWQPLLIKAIDLSRGQNDNAETEFRLSLATLYRLQGKINMAQACLQEAMKLNHIPQSTQY